MTLSISVPLSQALVAFTIEVDNEADHRIEHWTSMSGKREGVWQTLLHCGGYPDGS